ncbi:MAG: hypothetical protein JWL69_4426 [Phycisphaerales bacterium]|nr:hypothetical protein [Phycisphaerales bacterium]
MNNKLYAVFPDTSPGQNQVVVIDTATMAQEKTFTAPVTLTGITADAAGNIYATSGTTLYKLDANGNILGSLNASWALDNIKISPTGQLIMDNNGGQIVMSSTKLSSSNEFTLNEPNAQLYESYAAFATPLPEPVSGLTCLVMAGALMRRPCRRAN